MRRSAGSSSCPAAAQMAASMSSGSVRRPEGAVAAATGARAPALDEAAVLPRHRLAPAAGLRDRVNVDIGVLLGQAAAETFGARVEPSGALSQEVTASRLAIVLRLETKLGWTSDVLIARWCWSQAGLLLLTERGCRPSQPSARSHSRV